MRSKLTAAIVAGLLLFAASCGDDDDDGATTTTEADGGGTEDPVLGAPDPAEGEPVKVGLVSNGAGQGFDTSYDEPIARATIEWVNEYRNGIGGRPIELVVCIDRSDPSGASDCGAEMVREGVVAVVFGATGQYEAAWRPLHEAGIPTFIQIGGGSAEAVVDDTNTFHLTDTLAPTVYGPIALAEEVGTDKVSVVAVDLPAATSPFTEGKGPKAFEDAGIDLDLIPVPITQPDMTPEMIRLVDKNPDGVVLILGTEAFCIAALNGLETAGFEGEIAANESCIGEATRKAIPGAQLEGIRTHGGTPLHDEDNESTRLYHTILERFDDTGVDPMNAGGTFVFIAVTGLDAATQELEGEVTAESVAAAAKSMPWVELPGSGGRHFRCNGKVDPDRPAVCSSAVLYAVLGDDGRAATFEVVGDEEIPD